MPYPAGHRAAVRTPAGVESVLYIFGASIADGYGPSGGLIQGTDGNFYGTTSNGGAFVNDGSFCIACSFGTVYRITPAGAETVLHSFPASGSDGTSPFGLIQGTDGNLYGTTLTGGANGNGGNALGDGTVYKINPAGVETVLHSFGASSADGLNPGGVIQGMDGNLYGITIGGGVHNDGTFYMITLAGVETILHSFGASSTDGVRPGSLIQGADGNFYGVTASGGAHGGGTFFMITPAGAESVVYSFGASSTDGTGTPAYLPNVSPLFLDRHWDGHVYGRNDLPNPAAQNPSVDKDEVARTPALSRPRLAALDDRSVAKETNVGVVQVI
jgi:uncharacterized repeat protein (TIGR03803 family)